MGSSYLKHILLVLLLVFVASVFGQTEIKSKVVDFTTLLPLENASIYLENTTIGTVSNVDGKFVLRIPQGFEEDSLIISSIGYKSYKSAVKDFDSSEDVFLVEDIASLDEVLLVADPRPVTGNDIVLKAIERLPRNLPEEPYLQKGFLRHKERNTKEYKWLIESAISLYDSSFASGASENLKINVDEVRKSYDLREVDSLYSYTSFLKYNARNIDLKAKNLLRDTIETESLIKAIRWNDSRVNGLGNLFKGKLNLIRNSNLKKALFGEDILNKHQFSLDTILVDDGRKIYKIKISKSLEFVGLDTRNIYNEGFEAQGWIYIYWDNYAIKKIEYELIAASEAQRSRSKSLFNTLVNHKLVMTYMEYEDKMYPSYIYYESPKLVNVGDRSSEKEKREAESGKENEEQFYFTIQEILFSEVIHDPEVIQLRLIENWSDDIFSSKPYNEEFWQSYNVLLESEEEEKMIKDLSKQADMFKK